MEVREGQVPQVGGHIFQGGMLTPLDTMINSLQ